MADRELNPSLPNESPGHWTVAPNLPLMTIPLEKKSNFFFPNCSSVGVSIEDGSPVSTSGKFIQYYCKTVIYLSSNAFTLILVLFLYTD